MAKRKQSKLPPHCDPIITRSCAKEMSTSGPSTPEVSPVEFAQMKEQMSELMRMMQQLVVGEASYFGIAKSRAKWKL